MSFPKPILYWHVHHDTLCEELTYPLQQRIDHIKQHKPITEIETRLKLLKPCSDQAIKAWLVYSKAESEAWSVYQKAESEWSVYHKAELEARSELELLHKIECKNCPWNGETILRRSSNSDRA